MCVGRFNAETMPRRDAAGRSQKRQDTSGPDRSCPPHRARVRACWFVGLIDLRSARDPTLVVDIEPDRLLALPDEVQCPRPVLDEELRRRFREQFGAFAFRDVEIQAPVFARHGEDALRQLVAAGVHSGLVSEADAQTDWTVQAHTAGSPGDPTVSSDHHTSHRSASARTIGSPALHWNASRNSGRFDSGPLTRYFATGCGSPWIMVRCVSGRVSSPRH